jgi:hypothetical protein
MSAKCGGDIQAIVACYKDIADAAEYHREAMATLYEGCQQDIADCEWNLEDSTFEVHVLLISQISIFAIGFVIIVIISWFMIRDGYAKRKVYEDFQRRNTIAVQAEASKKSQVAPSLIDGLSHEEFNKKEPTIDESNSLSVDTRHDAGVGLQDVVTIDQSNPLSVDTRHDAGFDLQDIVTRVDTSQGSGRNSSHKLKRVMRSIVYTQNFIQMTATDVERAIQQAEEIKAQYNARLESEKMEQAQHLQLLKHKLEEDHEVGQALLTLNRHEEICANEIKTREIIMSHEAASMKSNVVIFLKVFSMTFD